jgi:hypothetical protein
MHGAADGGRRVVVINAQELAPAQERMRSNPGALGEDIRRIGVAAAARGETFLYETAVQKDGESTSHRWMSGPADVAPRAGMLFGWVTPGGTGLLPMTGRPL